MGSISSAMKRLTFSSRGRDPSDMERLNSSPPKSSMFSGLAGMGTSGSSVGGVAVEVTLGIGDQHGVDLLVGDPALPQVRQHVVVYVKVMPLTGRRRHQPGVDPVDVARRIVGEHQALVVTPAAHLDDDVAAGLEARL